ncbi:MAG: rhodanese-like domain-containing protein [bacterium]
MTLHKNNKYIITFIIFLGIFFVCVLVFTKFNVFKKIDVSTLDDTLNAEEFYVMKDQPNIEILDLRTPEEYNYGHIEGVTNINFYDTLKFISEIEKLDKNKRFLIYCRTDRRSGRTLEIMREKGFANIYLLKGGILAWKLDGRPVIKERIK